MDEVGGSTVTLAARIDATKWALAAGRDVPWLLSQWVERAPDKPFLVWEPFSGSQRTWSYREFAAAVDAVAAALHARGVVRGERVLLHLDNCPEFPISWFACAKLGAVAVSTNTRSVARDLEYFSDHAEVVCAITQPRFAKLVHESAPHLRFLAVTEDDAGEPSGNSLPVEHVPFADLLAETATVPERPVDPMADLGIQYTSGTTSRPKAVLWTHANAVWGARLNALHMNLRHDDIGLTSLPLFHTNAQSYSMLGTLWAGATMVLTPRFSASRFWEVSLRNRCTWTSMIPFCLKALAALPTPAAHSYRFWAPAVHLPDVDERYGVLTIGWWGMTETVTHGIVVDLHHPGGLMSIGRASPGYEISVRRTDGTGSEIGPGERGSLFIRGVRGVSLFKEYYKDEAATAASFDADGWFETGDVIRMGEDGTLFFSDRAKDMLKVGGENVAASEIEAVILESGWVSECSVVGQRHAMLDEVPVAFVIAGPNPPPDLASSIIDLCKANLSDFKVVREVHIVDELPRSTLEKVAKNALRERLPLIEA
jgi:carnitine-CoA ligase